MTSDIISDRSSTKKFLSDSTSARVGDHPLKWLRNNSGDDINISQFDRKN